MCRMLNNTNSYNLVEINGTIVECDQDEYLECVVKNFLIPNDFTVKIDSNKNIYNIRFDINGKIKSIEYE